ncbi:MAG: cation:proton antiporter [Bdellovibrionaceae bacterium]|nr:cation:proton antiporter [Bdellovibrionales bacterium]MCB9086335.1 cation:proton antiporter [Pseudobdellovibrionaceae bacterium]
MAYAIIGLAVLFFLGHALNWLFIKTKIPDLLILVIMGYLAGPVFGVLKADDFGKVGPILSTMALVVILYEGGLHLSARDLLRSSLPAFKIAILGFLMIATSAFAIAFLLGFQPWHIALLLGIGLGSTSSAIVIPMVKPLSVRDDTKTILSLESAFTDVIIIVLFLVLTDSIASGVFSPREVLVGIGPKPLLAILMGIGSGTLWAFLRRRFGPVVSMTFAGEAWALLSYGVFEATGYNGALGVLALGFTLANLDLLPEWLQSLLSREPVSVNELGILSEITFILRTFFFIYLGLLIQFSSLQVVLIAFALTAAIFATRYFAVRLLFSTKEWPRLDAMVITSMGPRGLACAVLATLPLQKGIEGGQWLQNAMFATIPMTIFLTALFVSLSEREGFRRKAESLFKAYLENSGTPQPDLADGSAQEIIASEDQKHPELPHRSDSEPSE